MPAPAIIGPEFAPQAMRVPARQESRRVALASILPVVVLFYAALLPQEIRFSLLEQQFYPYRIAIFGLLPWVFFRLGQGEMRWNVWDVVFLIGSAWIIISLMAVYNPATGLRRGGAAVLDAFMPYLVTRLCIRSTTDLRRILVMIVPGVFLAGSAVMAESLLQRPIVRPIFSDIFGPLARMEDGVTTSSQFITEKRLGLMRATGPFAHPILGGVFLASLLPLFWASGVRSWPLYAGLFAGVCSFFSLSSAAFLSLLIAGSLLTFDYVQRITSFVSWRLFIPGLAALLAAIHIASPSGIVAILVRYTLNPQTGRFRTLIWEYGTASVERHPWVGIGFQEYVRLRWMVPSVDNHFLLLAIRHGLVTPVLFFLVSVVGVAMLALASRGKPEPERRFLVGIAICLFAFVIVSFTTSFFGGAQTWFYMMIGVAISLGAARARPQ
ncbi:MAG: hypothetical protein AAGK02_02400 [Pseudomonadota bacterium]